MRTPLITVVLTSYNHSKYIHDFIESVLAQTFDNFVLLIWDDGSNDGSIDIINSFKDKRITLIREKANTGGFGINRLFANIGTGLIAIHHSDDIWLPNKLGRQIDILRNRPDLVATFSHVSFIGEDGQHLSEVPRCYENVFNVSNRSKEDLVQTIFLWLKSYLSSYCRY